ncbi:O-antigen ligase family protein [Marisediminicola senii]|uniref:O-antigen ligase family protein n=1 Tax=Marisediminicola senii TaxID=2711233 RepID=UPI0013EB16BC|nr:O-antigen ligase family protein [Marisediminicola senii]
MTTTPSRRPLVAFAAAVFFIGLAPDAVRNSISWYGFGAVVLAMVVASIVLIVRDQRRTRDRITMGVLPWPLLGFLALAAASTAWSFYPRETAIAVVLQLATTAVVLPAALLLTPRERLRTLGLALRSILALSLLFELVVALIVRAPVLPVWVTGADRVDPPLLLFWSRNLLLEGGPVQGIVGSSSLLAMAGLLGLIVFGVQLAAGTVRRAAGVLWMLLAIVTIALTRSATITLGLAAVIAVCVFLLVMRRASTRRARLAVYGVGAAIAAAGIGAALIARPLILEALGKSADLTGRLGIWDAVIGLAEQRPAAGWGWISFWAPWVAPFDGLVTRNGVAQLHAHNAWLDVWLQLGVIGLVVFGVLIVSTGIRAFFLATDRLPSSATDAGGFSTISLLAPLLLTALLVQSLAESRILSEGGWMLLVMLAVTTKSAMLGRHVPLGTEVVVEDRRK